ncbi:MAG: hypothetical protein K6A45_03505 [Lachnospiraceae bacterium]|nr:hypothetical protein [Lachnospiraceae bacterium]
MKKLSNIIETKQPVVYICIFFFSLLLSFTATNNPFLIGNTSYDSSVFNYVGKVILGGGMPYRDSFDHKGPLIYLIDALGQLIHKHLGIWFIELTVIFIILVLAYKTAKLSSCNNIRALYVVLATMISLALYLDGGNLVEEYACLFIMLQLYIFMLFFYDREINTLHLILSGVSFGAVCLLRINMVSLWIVMCIGVLIKCIKENKIKMVGRFIICFLTGIILIVLPVIIWLISGNAFKPFLEDYFSFNFLYSSYSENGTLFNIIKSTGIFILTPPVLLSVIFLTLVGLKDKKLFDWLCLFALFLSIIMSCMAGQCYLHYGMIFCPFVAYAFSLAFTSEHILQWKIFKHKGKLVLGIGIALVLCIICLTVIGFPITTLVSKVTGLYRTDYFSDSKAIADIVVENTDENDKIIVLGTNDIIYLLSDRMSSSKYSYQVPILTIDPDKKAEFITDVKKLDAKIIVTGQGTSVKPFVEDILAEHYTLIKTYDQTEIYKLN